jgi:thiamine biosynthesis protein ThiI
MGLILVRYVGEIGIKGKNRFYFVKRLRHNLRDALKQSSTHSRVWSEGQRIYAEVQNEDQAGAGAEQIPRRTLEVLQRVFGVASLSPVYQVPPDLQAIQESAVTVAERAGLRPPMSFRVRAQRADKSFPYRSPDIGRIVGGAVWQRTQADVDLSDAADLTIGVEVRPEGALVFGETIPGPSGMPLGTQGRVFSLLSGG